MARWNSYKVDNDEVISDYFANDGDFDWRKAKDGKPAGKPGKWKYTLRDIRKKYKFRYDTNILDRVRKQGIQTRSVLDGRPMGMRPGSKRDGPPRGFQLAKQAGNAYVLRAALTSPRVAQALHRVAKDLAKAMGASAPSIQDISRFLGGKGI